MGQREKTKNSAQAMETARAEKEALEKNFQELARIENERRELQEKEIEVSLQARTVVVLRGQVQVVAESPIAE